jgi:hypothetical protein
VELDRLHEWPHDADEALALQERLRESVRLLPLTAMPSRVAGADVAYSAERRRLFAAAAVIALPSLEVIEVFSAERAEEFPYVPGLFAFRELPALLDALAGLQTRPDAVLFDGHGVAHPRRFGLASHAGLTIAGIKGLSPRPDSVRSACDWGRPVLGVNGTGLMRLGTRRALLEIQAPGTKGTRRSRAAVATGHTNNPACPSRVTGRGSALLTTPR